jgi:hypothetical protein
MSYTIYKSDGTVLTTIADGALDNTTNLTLPGPNYVGYGQKLNENLVYLLENFSSNTVPTSNNLQGQLWFNKSNQTLNVFTNQGYLPVAGATVSGTQPAIAKIGDTWFNSTTNQFYVYDGTGFNFIGPLYTKAMGGQAGAIPVAVGDANSTGVYHNIVQIQFAGTIIAVFSSDAAFTPSPPMSGFASISPGINYNSTINAVVYGNTQVASYLPVDPTINALYANAAQQTAQITATNAAIVTANTGVISYVLTAISANTTAVNAAIVTANTASVNYTNTLNAAMLANITVSNAAIVTANTYNSNYTISTNTAMKFYVDAVTAAWTANAAVQDTYITAANAAIVTANAFNINWTSSSNSSMKTYVDAIDAVLLANAATQTIEISGLRANIIAANAAIVTANAAMRGFVTDQVQTPLGPVVLKSYSNTQLGAISTTTGAVAFCTTTNTPAYYVSPHWYFYSNNAILI